MVIIHYSSSDWLSFSSITIHKCSYQLNSKEKGVNSPRRLECVRAISSGRLAFDMWIVLNTLLHARTKERADQKDNICSLEWRGDCRMISTCEYINMYFVRSDMTIVIGMDHLTSGLFHLLCLEILLHLLLFRHFYFIFSWTTSSSSSSVHMQQHCLQSSEILSFFFSLLAWNSVQAKAQKAGYSLVYRPHVAFCMPIHSMTGMNE